MWRGLQKKLQERREEKEAGKAPQTWSNSSDVHRNLSREREVPDPPTLEIFCGTPQNPPEPPSPGRDPLGAEAGAEEMLSQGPRSPPGCDAL